MEETFLKPGESMQKKVRTIEDIAEKVETKKEDFSSLLKVKGIGKETLLDLERIYNSIDELKKALEEDKVSLRNDKVKKLKKALLR